METFAANYSVHQIFNSCHFLSVELTFPVHIVSFPCCPRDYYLRGQVVLVFLWDKPFNVRLWLCLKNFLLVVESIVNIGNIVDTCKFMYL